MAYHVMDGICATCAIEFDLNTLFADFLFLPVTSKLECGVDDVPWRISKVSKDRPGHPIQHSIS